MRGLRPLRTSTVTHSLVKALCGQLISSREARRIEARLLRVAAPAHAGFHLPPTRAAFAPRAPAETLQVRAGGAKGVCARTDLACFRHRTAARSRHGCCRSEDRRRAHARPLVGRCHLPPGLGRYEHGLVGDLGLMKLCTTLLGRPATSEDTAELLRPYGEWARSGERPLLAGGAGWALDHLETPPALAAHEPAVAGRVSAGQRGP